METEVHKVTDEQAAAVLGSGELHPPVGAVESLT